MRIGLISALVLSFGLMACGGGGGDTSADAASAAQNDSAEAGERQVVPGPEGSKAGEAMILGDPNAPIKVIEYASVTCPACAAFHAQVLPEIKEKFIDTGKIAFEFREFPTAPANLAFAGFYVARCAATDRGAPAYYAMINALFEAQREWAYGPNPAESLREIAAQAGIDSEEFETCLYRQDVRDAVGRSFRIGREEDNVNATPTILINGEVVDRRSTSVVEAIEAALAEQG